MLTIIGNRLAFNNEENPERESERGQNGGDVKIYCISMFTTVSEI